jgi:DNA-binding transcriptional ArsR family regulator
MVTQARINSSAVFGAVADPTRRAILDALRDRSLPAGEIARHFPISRPAVSRHLRVLREAGLVTERREAQARWYSIVPEPLAELDAWLNKYRLFWAARLHDIKHHVEGGIR